MESVMKKIHDIEYMIYSQVIKKLL